MHDLSEIEGILIDRRGAPYGQQVELAMRLADIVDLLGVDAMAKAVEAANGRDVMRRSAEQVKR